MNDITEFTDYLESNFDAVYVSGGNQIKLNGQCPFCGEERADLRLYVNPANGMGVCHHCGEGFGPHKFVMAREECSFAQACAIIEGDLDGWERTAVSQPQVQPELVWPLAEQIKDSPEAQAYLEGRCINYKLADHFGLYFSRHSLTMGGRLYHTENRIIIPIHDITGRPVTWQARTIYNARPKYLFPPAAESADVLFNAWSIQDNADYIIICEGLFDAFGWWRHGAGNVVATFGKKISPEQLSIIRQKNPKLVFIAWDSDAMLENYNFAESYGYAFDIRIVDLKGKDADECSGCELTIALESSKRYSWEDKMLSLLNS